MEFEKSVRNSKTPTLSEVTIFENSRRDQRPDVQNHADPTRRDFNPRRWFADRKIINSVSSILRVQPVRDGHHNVQSTQQQHQVKKGIAISNCVFLIIIDIGTFHIRSYKK